MEKEIIYYNLEKDGTWKMVAGFDLGTFDAYYNGRTLHFNTLGCDTKITFADAHIIIPEDMDGILAGKQVLAFLTNQVRKKKLSQL